MNGLQNADDPQFAGAVGTANDPNGPGVTVNFDNEIDVFSHKTDTIVVSFNSLTQLFNIKSFSVDVFSNNSTL